MEIKIFGEDRSDSVTYRKIFEFIQKEGIEPFVKFIDD